jgi:hypothetical protein
MYNDSLITQLPFCAPPLQSYCLRMPPTNTVAAWHAPSLHDSLHPPPSLHVCMPAYEHFANNPGCHKPCSCLAHSVCMSMLEIWKQHMSQPTL